MTGVAANVSLQVANPQSLNLYAYVENNPVTATDPDGHTAFSSLMSAGYGGTAICGIDNTDTGCGDPTSGGSGVVETNVSEMPPELTTLVNAQNAARQQYPPNAAGTYCNLATCAIAQAVGAPMGPLESADGQPLLANEMAVSLAASATSGGAYREVSPAEAQKLADQGALVIGAWYNPDGPGHVVTVRPEGVPGDSPVGNSGPLVNDVGKYDRVSRESKAFGASDNVHYYTPAGGGGH